MFAPDVTARMISTLEVGELIVIEGLPNPVEGQPRGKLTPMVGIYIGPRPDVSGEVPAQVLMLPTTNGHFSDPELCLFDPKEMALCLGKDHKFVWELKLGRVATKHASMKRTAGCVLVTAETHWMIANSRWEGFQDTLAIDLNTWQTTLDVPRAGSCVEIREWSLSVPALDGDEPSKPIVYWFD